MTFLEAMKKCDFENGDYIINEDSNKQSAIKLLNEQLQLVTEDTNKELTASINWLLNCEWKIRNKYIKAGEAIAECKKGKKIRSRGWPNAHIEYVVASDRFIAVLDNGDVQWYDFNILDKHKWEIVE